MKLSELGEFGLIDTMISPRFKDLVQKNHLGIGDDCAVMPLNDQEYQIVTTDMLVEDVHFLRERIGAADLGFKSLAVNLSDIAAMGGTPTGSFLSIAFPKDIDTNWIESFLEGYRELAAKEQTPLLGGDTTKSRDKIIINVAVVGRVVKDQIKYRSAAQEGDFICVPDPLGDSAGGLQIILNQLPEEDEAAANLLRQHYRPYPRIKEGRFFGKHQAVHAMLDISDGINSDLKHILNASGVSAELYMENIPVSQDLRQAAAQYSWNIPELALSGGEDYSLLLTVAPGAFAEVAERFQVLFHRPLYAIGKIRAGKPEIHFLQEGRETDPIKNGYTHF